MLSSFIELPYECAVVWSNKYQFSCIRSKDFEDIRSDNNESIRISRYTYLKEIKEDKLKAGK